MTDPSPASQEALHFQPEWCRVTLASIGDAVITTDIKGGVTFLNPVAQSLTGWTPEEAAGQPLDSVFRIINEKSRQSVESPTVRALREGVVVGLANHSLLIAKDGTERPIDYSAAPICNEKGEVAGVVLVFRDISERRRQEQRVQDALTYAENIIATLREPFVVSRQEPASPNGEPGFLPDLLRRERGDGRPIHL
jgi:PAS domain S-box-containing protein